MTSLLSALESPAQPATECLDILPVRGGKRGCVKWIPHSDDYTPLAGYAVVTTDRDTTSYAVSEFVASVGRGFMFAKLGGKATGTDRTESHYAVFCGGSAAADQCECKGFARWGHCKHADTVRTLLNNNWL